MLIDCPKIYTRLHNCGVNTDSKNLEIHIPNIFSSDNTLIFVVAFPSFMIDTIHTFPSAPSYDNRNPYQPLARATLRLVSQISNATIRAAISRSWIMCEWCVLVACHNSRKLLRQTQDC